MATLSVIIVNYQGERFVEPLVRSLAEQTLQPLEVIVVDNASTDGSWETHQRLAPLLTRPTFVALDKNVGFAAGFNRGWAVSKGDLILVINNDLTLDPECLRHLCQAANDPNIGMFAPQIRLLKDPTKLDSAGLRLYADGVAKQWGHGEEASNHALPGDALMPSGCAAGYRRSLLEALGGYDQDFFMYCEDTDLGIRAQRAGWKGLYVPDAVVYHAYSGTAGAFSGDKAYYVERNRIWVVMKNYPMPLIPLTIPMTGLRYLCQALALAMNRGTTGQFVRSTSPWAVLTIMAKAYRDALRGLPRILRKRRTGPRRGMGTLFFMKLLFRFRISALRIAFME